MKRKKKTEDPMKDIESEAGIRMLVDRFYEKVQKDERLGPVFNARIKNWDEHLPRMYRFWASLLFGTPGYRGNPFEKHLGLAIDKKHFDRWLQLFESTLDENFKGKKAEEARQRARSIASIFMYKLSRFDAR